MIIAWVIVAGVFLLAVGFLLLCASGFGSVMSLFWRGHLPVRHGGYLASYDERVKARRQAHEYILLHSRPRGRYEWD